MCVVKKGDISEVATVLAGYDRNGQLALCAEAMNEAERLRSEQVDEDRQKRELILRLLFDDQPPVDHDHIQRSFDETKRFFRKED